MFRNEKTVATNNGFQPFNFLSANQTDSVFDNTAKTTVWQRISRILSKQNPNPKTTQPQIFSTSRRIVRVANIGANQFERVRNFENFISGVRCAK